MCVEASGCRKGRMDLRIRIAPTYPGPDLRRQQQVHAGTDKQQSHVSSVTAASTSRTREALVLFGLAHLPN
jgi:hypothetical protein